MAKAEFDLESVDAWQLCYDGKVIDEGIDRFVLISQYSDHDLETKVTKPVQVKSFPKNLLLLQTSCSKQ